MRRANGYIAEYLKAGHILHAYSTETKTIIVDSTIEVGDTNPHWDDINIRYPNPDKDLEGSYILSDKIVPEFLLNEYKDSIAYIRNEDIKKCIDFVVNRSVSGKLEKLQNAVKELPGAVFSKGDVVYLKSREFAVEHGPIFGEPVFVAFEPYDDGELNMFTGMFHDDGEIKTDYLESWRFTKNEVSPAKVVYDVLIASVE